MLALVPAFAACAGLALGAGRPGPERTHARWRASDAVEQLAVRLELAGEGELGITGEHRSERGAMPPCLADVCQPLVSVPGMEQRFARPQRTELILALLDRADVEPLATITWALVATGLRFDYTPSSLDGNPTGRGWGSVFVRLRLRLGADNLPTIPQRTATRARPQA